MVQTSVRLRNDQWEALRELAQRRGVSVDELIQEGIEWVLRTAESDKDAERWRRAMAAAGRFRSGQSDISEKHDLYLSEVFDS